MHTVPHRFIASFAFYPNMFKCVTRRFSLRFWFCVCNCEQKGGKIFAFFANRSMASAGCTQLSRKINYVKLRAQNKEYILMHILKATFCGAAELYYDTESWH